ncbi:MAG: hypothetical protein HOD49_06055 [Anaerolineae bacterium]|jgi:hypothetical protein|nr:hypothetical protein [Anaerolineae bacterium]MBT6763738.1 hypothetical protein [Prolixibacteraceae bacterium]
MHPYTTDEEITKRVFILSAILAISLTWVYYTISEAYNINIPWWLETPSVLALFGFFYWLFDNYLWKTKLLQKTEWFAIPNLNGIWDVEIKTSHDNFEATYLAKSIIRQTASKISITLETKFSSSHSLHASLLKVSRLNKYELVYVFENRPNTDRPGTFQIHLGTAIMAISDDLKTMKSDYFTGRGRQTVGTALYKRGDNVA